MLVGLLRSARVTALLSLLRRAVTHRDDSPRKPGFSAFPVFSQACSYVSSAPSIHLP